MRRGSRRHHQLLGSKPRKGDQGQSQRPISLSNFCGCRGALADLHPRRVSVLQPKTSQKKARAKPRTVPLRSLRSSAPPPQPQLSAFCERRADAAWSGGGCPCPRTLLRAQDRSVHAVAVLDLPGGFLDGWCAQGCRNSWQQTSENLSEMAFLGAAPKTVRPTPSLWH